MPCGAASPCLAAGKPLATATRIGGFLLFQKKINIWKMHFSNGFTCTQVQLGLFQQEIYFTRYARGLAGSCRRLRQEGIWEELRSKQNLLGMGYNCKKYPTYLQTPIVATLFTSNGSECQILLSRFVQIHQPKMSTMIMWPCLTFVFLKLIDAKWSIFSNYAVFS
jgi:hypothetical protein